MSETQSPENQTEKPGSASAPATPPPANGNTGPTAAELQAMLDKVNNDLKNERALRLSQEEKVREINQQRDQVRTPPTTATDPLDARIAAIRNQIDVARKAGYEDPTAETILEGLQAQKQANIERAAYQEAMRSAEPVFNAVTDPAVAERARKMYREGNAASPEIAILAAKGELYDKTSTERTEFERLAKEKDAELQRRLANSPGAPRGGSGGGPTVETEMTLDAYNAKVLADPSGEGRRLRKLKDEGKLRLRSG